MKIFLNICYSHDHFQIIISRKFVGFFYRLPAAKQLNVHVKPRFIFCFNQHIKPFKLQLILSNAEEAYIACKCEKRYAVRRVLGLQCISDILFVALWYVGHNDVWSQSHLTASSIYKYKKTSFYFGHNFIFKDLFCGMYEIEKFSSHKEILKILGRFLSGPTSSLQKRLPVTPLFIDLFHKLMKVMYFLAKIYSSYIGRY